MAHRAVIRILIVDDHPIVREGLRTLLGDEPGMEVVGEAGDAEESVRQTAELSPDIILMDVALPGRSGIEAAAAIRKQGSTARVILLTSAIGDDLKLQDAIDTEVMGYLLKDVSRGDLLRAIASVHEGAPVFHPIVQKQLLRRATGAHLPHEKLTPRELDILKAIANGKSNKVIAFDLNLTEGTVKGYVSVVLSKLGVADRTQAALYAVKHQLVDV